MEILSPFSALFSVLIQYSFLNVAFSLSSFNQFESNDAIFDILVDYEELIGSSTREDNTMENFSLPVVISLFTLPLIMYYRS